ncbi:MAG: PaRep2b protein [Thermoproteus sp.]|nr:PaRep2b protein [Thermoproteus sp.]
MERVGEEVWGVVEFALSDMRRLARDCAGDKIARKFVAPALELMMLEKAFRGEFDRREALLRFGEMYATAIAGDGAVESRRVVLTVGGELGGGAALLRLATLYLLNELLPEDLKFGVYTYVVEGRYYRIAAYGGDAARLMRLLAVAAPSAGGEYLSPKFDKFVEEARVEVRLDRDGIRRTKRGLVAADLTISEGGVEVKYNAYLRNDILLQFVSTDRSRAELAARLLRLAGVNAEVKKEGGEDVWRVWATTDRLAAGRRELRDAIADIVREALARGWVDAGRAERWLDKLESGLTLREGWPKYYVGLTGGGSLEVRYRSTDPKGIEREARRLEAMGLVGGIHFTVKMQEGGGAGYVSILREGLAYAAWLSVHGSEGQRELAADFVEYILQRAREEGREVHEKAEEVVDRGREVGSLRLADVRGVEVDVGGRRHVVSVLGGGAGPERSNSGRTLLRIKITAEVDGVRRDYEVTFSRRGSDNAALGRAYARASAPGGREADAERLAALIKALTGKEPKVYRVGNKIMIECGREHLEGFMRYTELAEAIARWLEETGRR